MNTVAKVEKLFNVVFEHSELTNKSELVHAVALGRIRGILTHVAISVDVGLDSFDSAIQKNLERVEKELTHSKKHD